MHFSHKNKILLIDALYPGQKMLGIEKGLNCFKCKTLHCHDIYVVSLFEEQQRPLKLFIIIPTSHCNTAHYLPSVVETHVLLMSIWLQIYLLICIHLIRNVDAFHIRSYLLQVPIKIIICTFIDIP